ncbi:MAG: PF20097 family protein [Candidatus Thorarchaeota archaeon]
MKNACPYCDEPMYVGYIVSGRGIYWNRQVPTFLCRGGETLSSSWLGCASVLALRCKKCGVIIIPKDHHYRFRIKDSGICPFCGEDHKYSEEDISEDKIVQCKSCGEDFLYRE